MEPSFVSLGLRDGHHGCMFVLHCCCSFSGVHWGCVQALLTFCLSPLVLPGALEWIGLRVRNLCLHMEWRSACSGHWHLQFVCACLFAASFVPGWVSWPRQSQFPPSRRTRPAPREWARYSLHSSVVWRCTAWVPGDGPWESGNFSV